MKRLFGLALLLSLFTLSTSAQTVDEILENYFENIGGVEAWKSLQSIKMTGTSSMGGMEFPITIYSKRPNFEKLEIEVQGMQIVQAFDGEVAWGINPMAGSSDAVKADDEANKEAAKKRFEDELIDYKAKGHSIELLGMEEIEGAETHKLKLTKKDGDEVIYFFDSENFVPIMIKSFAGSGPMKGQAIETFLSDYEEVEGLVMPMSMSQKVGGNVVMAGTMKVVELNGEIANDIFMFPEPKEEKMEEVKEATDVKEMEVPKEEMKAEKMEVKKEMMDDAKAVKEVVEKAGVKLKEKGKKKKKNKKKSDN